MELGINMTEMSRMNLDRFEIWDRISGKNDETSDENVGTIGGVIKKVAKKVVDEVTGAFYKVIIKVQEIF